MAIQPEDFLALAQENLESSHEVHYRNAASRGYYAAYHAARALEHRYELLEGGGGGTHRAYIGRLQEYRDLSNPDTARSINSVGHILGQMVGTRNMADGRLNLESQQP